MLNTKSFLCLDFGAGSLKVAEFEPNENGTLRLKQFGIRPLGFEGSQDAARERVTLKAIQELLTEKSFGSRNINVCAPGFHVFSKFVKLPPVDTSKVTQIIQYEAQQNVPFPLEEVVWDYQILGTTPTGELEVLLVAIKAEIVESLFRTAEASGMRVQLVDVSPAALCNAFRYNYGDLEGCTMLLDIGAKTSNLLFFEKGKVYSRGINIGANSITQDFAAESKLKFPEAERLKIEQGFVSLGGAYEEPDNPQQAAISKIARQVMTRLHIQVNQTIQFYRGQQGGSAPQRLFLAGGASIMPYTAQFFAEKLNVAVEYLNPFRNIQIDSGINLEELAGVAHAFGEVVGLGLRNVAQCPVEMNLMPKSSLKRQQFNQKKPYFIATVISLVAVVFAYGGFYAKMAQIKSQSRDNIAAKVQPLKQKETELQAEQNKLNKLKQETGQLTEWVEQRFFWANVLSELRRVFMQAEAARKTASGIDSGVWIESFTSTTPGLTAAPSQEAPAESEAPSASQAYYQRLMMERYGLLPKGTAPATEGQDPTTQDTTAAAPATTPTSTNEISVITVKCRGLNMKRHSPTANDDLVFAVEKEIQASPLFDPKDSKLSGPIENVDAKEITFSFGVTLKLKRPMKL
ncbi:MAG TPA: type IV pilus assembly protein PilM [Verrucomicrobiae bacterium]|nr:type IV pilus assembly protein PilM [Verrucomicrobiae bacterium]